MVFVFLTRVDQHAYPLTGQMRVLASSSAKSTVNVTKYTLRAVQQDGNYAWLVVGLIPRLNQDILQLKVKLSPSHMPFTKPNIMSLFAPPSP